MRTLAYTSDISPDVSSFCFLRPPWKRTIKVLWVNEINMLSMVAWDRIGEYGKKLVITCCRNFSMPSAEPSRPQTQDLSQQPWHMMQKLFFCVWKVIIMIVLVSKYLYDVISLLHVFTFPNFNRASMVVDLTIFVVPVVFWQKWNQKTKNTWECPCKCEPEPQ